MIVDIRRSRKLKHNSDVSSLSMQLMEMYFSDTLAALDQQSRIDFFFCMTTKLRANLFHCWLPITADVLKDKTFFKDWKRLRNFAGCAQSLDSLSYLTMVNVSCFKLTQWDIYALLVICLSSHHWLMNSVSAYSYCGLPHSETFTLL